MIDFKKLKFVLVLAVIANNACAADLGKHGASFEIKEEGFISMIQRKLKTVDVEEHNRIMLAKVEKKINEPEPLNNITKAQEDRSWKYDPTYEVKDDIILPCGKLIARRGDKINPLEKMDFGRRLLIIDARDNKQVEWLKDKLYRSNILSKKENQEALEVDHPQTPIEDRVVLVGGSPIGLSEELGVPVYFDQNGELVSKFGIRHVPAVASESKTEKVLEIKEYGSISG